MRRLWTRCAQLALRLMSHGQASQQSPHMRPANYRLVYYCAACAYNTTCPLSSRSCLSPSLFLRLFLGLPVSVPLSPSPPPLSLPHSISLRPSDSSSPSLCPLSPLSEFLPFSLACFSCSFSVCSPSVDGRHRAAYSEMTMVARVPRHIIPLVYFYQRKCVVVRARIPAQPARAWKSDAETRGGEKGHVKRRVRVYFLSPVLSPATPPNRR